MELFYLCVLIVIIFLKITVFAFWFDHRVRNEKNDSIEYIIPIIGEVFMTVPDYLLLLLIFYKLYK